MKDKEFERKRERDTQKDGDREREKIAINNSYKLYKNIRLKLKKYETSCRNVIKHA